MAYVLIAEDSPTQAHQLLYLLEDAGHEVQAVLNGRQALVAMEKRLPDVVITDLEMPEVNGLQLVESIRSKYPGVPVVLMTAFGSEEVAALALQKGAVSYVPKRYLAFDIVPTINHLLSVVKTSRQRDRVQPLLVKSEFDFILDNDPALIPPVIGYLEDAIADMTQSDRTGLIRVSVALREAIVNAMHHGNLEVSSEEREQGGDTYLNLVERRRRQSPYRERRVYVTARISRLKAEFSVRDEGPGFDPEAMADPTHPSNLEKVCGRGLFLIRMFMDQVTHSETGNEITMVKFCGERT